MFRKVSFSSLLEPLVKLRQENQQRSIRLQQIDEKLTENKNLRDSFAKFANESCSSAKKPIKFYANDQENQDNDSVDESTVSHVLRHDDDDVDETTEDFFNEEYNEDDDAVSDEDEKASSIKQHSMSQLHLDNEKIQGAESPKVPKKFMPKLSIDYNTISSAGKYFEKMSPSMNLKSEAWSNIKKISDLKKLGKKVKQIKNSTKAFSQKNTSTTSINKTVVETEKQADSISMTSSHFLSVIQAKFNSATSSAAAAAANATATGPENRETYSVSNASSVLQIEFQVDSRNPSLKKKFEHLKQTTNTNLR